MEKEKALEIKYILSTGAFLFDPESKKSVPIYTGFVDEYFIGKKSSNCMDINPSTHGLAECVNEATKDWEAVLNRNLDILRRPLSKEAQKDLTTSQQTWVAYREAHQKAIGSAIGHEGSISSFRMAVAIETIVMDKAMELAHLIWASRN